MQNNEKEHMDSTREKHKGIGDSDFWQSKAEIIRR